MKYFYLLFTILISMQSIAQYRCQDLKNHGEAFSQGTFNNNAKSDTIDILHYNLELDLTDIPNRNLYGKCEIIFTPKLNNVNTISLDLLQLITDSIILNGNSLAFNHTAEVVKVNLGTAYSPADTVSIEVYYSGKPATDASGWGGFHTQNGYFFNLGVGFAADPHVYGRSWFPCFDNFVEHSTYHFTIETQDIHRAYCNGTETSNQVNNNIRTTTWNMTDPIPTYLASVTVSNYTDSSYVVNTGNSIIPVQLIAKAADLQNMLNAFENLDSNLIGFIEHFGPYRWQKVGYAITPIGAMEHATSIHFPLSLINQGKAASEDIMAHELAHHWWGNLVTCETADDMWINEGMAEFCSHLFYEDIYGRSRYIDVVRQNAFNVINHAHKQDNGYRAVYALPHNYVYGYHVYQKGAMVAHNLRAYLGDSLFFWGLTTLLNNNEFGNLNTQSFRDELSNITAENLTDFFDGWIFNEGFPSVAVDSFTASNNNAFIRVVQRLHHAPSIYKNLPVDITFFSNSGDTVHRTIVLNGATAQQNYSNLPFTPSFAMASYSGKLLTADTYDHFLLQQRKIYSDKFGKMRIELEDDISAAELIVMHHYAGPGGKTPTTKDYRISSNRYWTVNGLNLPSEKITAVIKYDGTAAGYDEDLLQHSEDSIVILYRATPADKWIQYPEQYKAGASGIFNKMGTIEIYNLKAGEYVLANSSDPIGIEEPKLKKSYIDIFPNPAREEININFENAPDGRYFIDITDAKGSLLYSEGISVRKENHYIKIPIDTSATFVTVQVNGLSYKVMLDQ